jgi:hypothetical protein
MLRAVMEGIQVLVVCVLLEAQMVETPARPRMRLLVLSAVLVVQALVISKPVVRMQ